MVLLLGNDSILMGVRRLAGLDFVRTGRERLVNKRASEPPSAFAVSDREIDRQRILSPHPNTSRSCYADSQAETHGKCMCNKLGRLIPSLTSIIISPCTVTIMTQRERHNAFQLALDESKSSTSMVSLNTKSGWCSKIRKHHVGRVMC